MFEFLLSRCYVDYDIDNKEIWMCVCINVLLFIILPCQAAIFVWKVLEKYNLIGWFKFTLSEEVRMCVWDDTLLVVAFSWDLLTLRNKKNTECPQLRLSPYSPAKVFI